MKSTNQVTPILIIGSERSGTNLLRTLLGHHSEITAPKPIHFLNTFNEHINNQVSDELLERLINELVALPFSDWEVELSISSGEKNSLRLMHSIYSQIAQKEGKTHYLNKDNDLHKIIPEFLKFQPNAKVLYIVRDPRDIVSSWLKTPVWHLNPIDPAIHWNNLNHRALQLYEEFHNSILQIKYEDLISRTELTMTDVLNFCRLPIEPACFSNKSGKVQSKNVLWKNLDKPVMTQNTLNYKSLSKAEVLAIESSIESTLLSIFDYHAEYHKIIHKSFRAIYKIGIARKTLRRYFAWLTLSRFKKRFPGKDLIDMKTHVDGGRKEFQIRLKTVIQKLDSSE